LNPELAGRIVAVQSFVSEATSGEPGIKAYASWQVGGIIKDAKHKVHGGIEKSTEGIGAVSLDEFCEEHEIERVDLVKIDTDGHEYEVLKGAREIIRKFRPVVIFEVGMYIMDERRVDFSDYLGFFESLDYSLFNSSNFKRINGENYHKHVPSKGTIDILAISNSVKV